MNRNRKAKIVATVGPASSSAATLEAMFRAGADVFRLNFSHGTHEDHKRRLAILRGLERTLGRPVGVLLDLQGPKLRIGSFANGSVTLEAGAAFRLDLNSARPGDAERVALPHPEIFAALETGARLLLDFGLSLGVDWIALSFVQRAEDIHEIRELVQGRAGIVAKLEKPAAIAQLDAIVEAADAVMVARGDLGVEMPAEQVPAIQKRIVRACRRLGKPVIVATQMLESMVAAPVPTRAEASDVASAVYDGADAVMLSAESASGKYPVEAVTMMNKIIEQAESDPYYLETVKAVQHPARAGIADAIGLALRKVADLLDVAATVAYTSSGHSALRVARERPQAPIIGMTPKLATARRLALVWGVHAVLVHDVASVAEMTDYACATAGREGLAGPGQTVVIAAGMPFGAAGTTNLLHIARLDAPPVPG